MQFSCSYLYYTRNLAYIKPLLFFYTFLSNIVHKSAENAINESIRNCWNEILLKRNDSSKSLCHIHLCRRLSTLSHAPVIAGVLQEGIRRNSRPLKGSFWVAFKFKPQESAIMLCELRSCCTQANPFYLRP